MLDGTEQSLLAVPLDGSAKVKAQRKRTKMLLAVLSGIYVFGGWGIFYIFESWDLLESLLFTLSILTGIGYGHVAPASSGGMVFSAVYIVCGLVLFSSLAGEVLEWMMEAEISTLMSSVKDFTNGAMETVRLTYEERMQRRKRRHFMVGVINLSVLYIAAVLMMVFYFREDLVSAIYLSAISVMKLDSICLLQGVPCNDEDSSVGSLTFAIVWYVVSFATVGQFMVAASSYLGSDPEVSVSRLHVMNSDRLARMDADHDGKVSRSEFLRDRLLQDGLVDSEVIDAILRNFDRLDKDKSGYISTKDVA
mmetsp:Transcript_36647/g.77893  ORF Transcript_36647/g.77893 Transcript_36647/m.77893 type:complete len:307 (+) Transcript_36647:105-1025(+)|eukprot:CAMPEP_0206457734 /NCGR_PEP_ID=MMETSP0324_2-20121206/23142_1 /ASSEMBLY_ACC=CAM_ASM_000836 /TAXON_ID=2866 /ORGANISM="Crypthecodinium cohnii, Strain Seligo" /LENGTH=306 /DNA_ID=CAMNT_0053928921 /DNA_START=99 /DNA_END=1019 /DNA_ORIENTATION=+